MNNIASRSHRRIADHDGMVIDHLVPVELAGRSTLANLCPYCGCAIRVATDWIGLPKQEEEMSLRDFRASVYPFCACAQAMESERLELLARRPDEWWAFAARWYHEKIAKPDSDGHRQNMLRGYPTWHLLKFIIDPNQEDDPL